MQNIGKIIVAGLMIAAIGAQATGSYAAAAATTPAATTKPATKPVAAATTKAPAGPAATGVVCQVVTKGKYVHIAAMNNGTAAVPVGATFAFTIVGPKKQTKETWTFKPALDAGKTVRRGGTVYLSAADESGMMVSFIQSNYMGFARAVSNPHSASACKTGATASAWNRPARIAWRRANAELLLP